VRVCYFGTYRAGYTRNRKMIEGLRRNGVEVIECHEPLWLGTEDRVQVASGGWMHPSFWLRIIKVYSRLLRKYRSVGDYDVMVLGYPGQLDVPLARVLTWLKCKPLVLDMPASLYLMTQERRLLKPGSFTGFLIYCLDKMACLLPNLLIVETEEYIVWFQKTFKINKSKFCVVPLGADDKIFKPAAATRSDGPFLAVYYGSFLPNHGVEYIVEAARLLRNEPNIHFELIGNGPGKAAAMALARQHNLTNITFEDWMDQEALVKRVTRADVILGAFGATPQSMLTVQNKIYEGLAMEKPVITGDGPSVRKLLIHGEHVYLCEQANPQSLAEAIKVLSRDPELRKSIARKGYQLYCQEFTPLALGSLLSHYINQLVESRKIVSG